MDEDNALPVQTMALPVKVFSYLALGAADPLGVIAFGFPCKLVGWSNSNHKTTELNLRLYDLARKPAAATDAAYIKLRLGMNATAAGSTQHTIVPLPGIPFQFGLSFTISTEMTSDVGVTAPTAGDAMINLYYV